MLLIKFYNYSAYNTIKQWNNNDLIKKISERNKSFKILKWQYSNKSAAIRQSNLQVASLFP